MNTRNQFFQGLKWFLFAFLLLLALPVIAAPLAQTNQTFVPISSVFVIPTSPKDGRDPFFPNSLRPYASMTTPSKPTTDLSSLAIQGTSGTPEHRLVIINHVTFGVGDDAEVSTPHGRIRIRCVEINDGSAVIEAAGQRQVIYYKEK